MNEMGIDVRKTAGMVRARRWAWATQSRGVAGSIRRLSRVAYHHRAADAKPDALIAPAYTISAGRDDGYSPNTSVGNGSTATNASTTRLRATNRASMRRTILNIRWCASQVRPMTKKLSAYVRTCGSASEYASHNLSSRPGPFRLWGTLIDSPMMVTEISNASSLNLTS